MINGQPESLAEALLLIEKQKKRISEQEEKIRAQQGEIKILNDKLAVKRAREFAAKTESLKKLAQMQPLLFDLEDLGITVEHQCPSPSDEEIEQAINDEDLFGRKNDKKKPGRKKNTSNLSRQKFVIDLSEEEKNCPKCGSKMVKVRELVSERVVHVPAMEYIEEVHRYVYECQECLDENDKPVRKAAKEKRIIEHSIATPELLAHIFISKYMKHTPFYCLEDAYNWQGVHISRQDMCNWSLKVHERLKNLENLFIRELKKAQLLMFDESPVQVLHLDEDEIKAEYWDDSRYRRKNDDSKDEGSRKNCYMWIVLGGTKEHPVYLYNFRWTRSGKNVLEFLEGFNGNLIQCDGYSGYNSAVSHWNLNHPDHKIELINCWVHARRGFADSFKATKSKHAAQALSLFKNIFDSENRLRRLYENGKISESEFLQKRKEEVKPHMDKLHAWLVDKQLKSMILDSSKTKEAVEYCLRRWENLENYINYPEVTFSTNEAERGVKSWVMAKKNFLFAGSGDGARASCFILSLIETAKQNGIAPEDYLRCLFEKAPYAETEEDWEKLLPWNIEITPYKIRGEWIQQ